MGSLRDKYNSLVQKAQKNINELYDRKVLLSKQRDELKQRLKELAQNKEFIVDVMEQNEIELASQELLAVIDSVRKVNSAIEQFAEAMTTDPGATDAETR